jgi:hypothetical protein
VRITVVLLTLKILALMMNVLKESAVTKFTTAANELVLSRA